jgi:hypothetical protein
MWGARTGGKIGGKSWHPGVLGHRYRGETLAYFMLQILADAISEVDVLFENSIRELESLNEKQQVEFIANGKNPEVIASDMIRDYVNTYMHKHFSQLNMLLQRQKYYSLVSNEPQQASKTNIMQSPQTEYHPIQKELKLQLPKSFSCDSTRHCTSNERTQCFTDYQPRCGNGLEDIILNSNNIQKILALRSDTGTYSLNSTCALSISEVVDSDIMNFDGSKSLHWRRELAWSDRSGVYKSIAEGKGYLDRKIVYTSTVDSKSAENKSKSTGENVDKNKCEDVEVNELAWLSFIIVTKSTSPLWLCEVQKGFSKYPDDMGDLDASACVFIRYDVDLTKPLSKNSKGDTPRKTNMTHDYIIYLSILCNVCINV